MAPTVALGPIFLEAERRSRREKWALQRRGHDVWQLVSSYGDYRSPPCPIALIMGNRLHSGKRTASLIPVPRPLHVLWKQRSCVITPSGWAAAFSLRARQAALCRLPPPLLPPTPALLPACFSSSFLLASFPWCLVSPCQTRKRRREVGKCPQ